MRHYWHDFVTSQLLYTFVFSFKQTCPVSGDILVTNLSGDILQIQKKFVFLKICLLELWRISMLSAVYINDKNLKIIDYILHSNHKSQTKLIGQIQYYSNFVNYLINWSSFKIVNQFAWHFYCSSILVVITYSLWMLN